VVRAEISGVRGDDLRVSVDGDRLRLSGVRSVPQRGDVQRLHQMEIAFGPFERTVRIQIPFERERVTAHLEDGFLEVRLPKQLPRQIRVRSEESESER
jgi:HSP20 family protein